MSEPDTFATLVGGQDWSTIDELLALLDRAHFWSEPMLVGAIEAAKKRKIRQLIKAAKDEAGYPRWESIMQPHPDGTAVRVYKQQEFFTAADYEQTIQYWVDRSLYAMGRAKDLRLQASKRYSLQLTFPWEVDGAQEN
jgi:hypothetical protein